MSYSDLVREDRVHSRVFTDPAIFDAEMRAIFGRTWVYVGHESEVAEPGDYLLRWIGREPVIMTRDEDGRVHLLSNRCRHRGATVCQQERGNSAFLRCAYHGWTYANDGRLTGVSFPNAYAEPLDPVGMGLSRIPSQEMYRGFVFGRLTVEGESLTEFLGLSAQYIDAAVDASPTGRVSLTAGAQKTYYQGNWKFIGMDGYHPNFGHRSVVNLAKRRAEIKAAADRAAGREGRTLDIGNSFTGKSPNLTEDLGNGHSRLETSINSFIRFDETIAPTFDHPEGREYLRQLAEVHGEDKVKQVLVDAYDPHVGIYPNVEIINTYVQLKRPISVDRTEVTMIPILLDGVPDRINEDRIATHEWFYGPSSFGTSDDTEMFERMQRGLQSELDPWVLLARGLHNEKTLEDGRLVGHITDEIPQRGMMRQWLILMEREEARA